MAEDFQKVNVGVDSGAIALATSQKAFEKALDVYGKGQELARWTARVIWDGRRGGVPTPTGDGFHSVILRVLEERLTEFSYDMVIDSAGREQARKGFQMYVGDVGRIDGVLEIPAYRDLLGRWIDDGTLELTAVIS